jgi:hypothetical protein
MFSKVKTIIDICYVIKTRTEGIEERTIKRSKYYGNTSTSVSQIESLIHIYKMNYVENLDYLLSYTGLKKKTYKNRLASMGVRNGIAVYQLIKTNRIVGFDIIVVASLANIFRLPTSLLLNYSLRDIEGFVPEDYGIYRNMYKSNSNKPTRNDLLVSPKSSESVYKKMFKKKASEESNNPKGVANIWNYVK